MKNVTMRGGRDGEIFPYTSRVRSVNSMAKGTSCSSETRAQGFLRPAGGSTVGAKSHSVDDCLAVAANASLQTTCTATAVDRLAVGRHFKNILSVRGGDKGGSNFFIQFLGVSTQFELIFFRNFFVEIF